jgi:DNA mismatch endonuclease, patch repair protein
MDVLTPQQRSYCMSKISGKNTKPELLIRRALFALGLRYRLHRRDLPGTPDLVFKKFNAVILVHGCFWHGHGCHLFVVPEKNSEFWIRKIAANRKRDQDKCDDLKRLGWRVLTIWECSLRGRDQLPIDLLADKIQKWLSGNSRNVDIPPKKHKVTLT